MTASGFQKFPFPNKVLFACSDIFLSHAHMGKSDNFSSQQKSLSKHFTVLHLDTYALFC